MPYSKRHQPLLMPLLKRSPPVPLLVRGVSHLHGDSPPKYSNILNKARLDFDST